MTELKVSVSENLVAVVTDYNYTPETKETWGYYGGEPSNPAEIEVTSYHLEYTSLDGTITYSEENRFDVNIEHYEEELIDQHLESCDNY